VEKGRKNREVYLPRGKWTDFWTGRENEGRKWVESTSDLPIYLRENSVIPMKSDRGSLQILLYGGSGEVKLRDGVTISYDGSSVAGFCIHQGGQVDPSLRKNLQGEGRG